MKAQTLEAGQFVESMLTSERNGKWNEKDVTREIYGFKWRHDRRSWFSNLSNRPEKNTFEILHQHLHFFHILGAKFQKGSDAPFILSPSIWDFPAESAYVFAQVATASPRAYFCVFIMPNLRAFLIKFTLKDTEYCSFPRLKHVDSRCDLVLVVFQRNPFSNLLKHCVSFSFTFRFVRQVV